MRNVIEGLADSIDWTDETILKLIKNLEYDLISDEEFKFEVLRHERIYKIADFIEYDKNDKL